MSIVITTNTNKELEINHLEGWLKHFSNWYGGEWSNLDVVKSPEKYTFFAFSENDVFELVVESTTINGVDCDMGKDIHWEAPSLLILVESPMLNVFIPIEKFFAENLTIAYMKKPNPRDNYMKVKELIELLKEQPQDADVLIDYRSTDNVEIDNSDDWYYHNKSEIVVHITT